MYQPTENRVIIERLETPKGGVPIVIPDSYVVPPNEGVVVCVGPGENLPGGGRRACAVAPGERVMFTEGVFEPVPGPNPNLIILADTAILAVIEPE